MANWTGTYTNPTPSGACTAASANTIEKTGAGWTINALTNQMVRITSGAGIGQTAYVASNTATVITIVGNWGITPAVGDTFEVVINLRNNDHIIANVQFDNTTITELEDSATIFVDGAYTIFFTNACTVRWNKTKSTLVTFQPNNITVQGVSGFWRYIRVGSALTVKPNLSYIKLKCANEGIYLQPSAILGSGSSIFNIWLDNASSNSLYMPGTAITENFTLTNWLVTRCYNAIFAPSLIASNFDEVFNNWWVEDNHSASTSWGAATCPLRQIIRNSVWKKSWYNAGGNIDNVNKQIKVIDSYFSTWTTQGFWARNTNAGSGNYFFSRNWSNMSREVLCTTVLSTVNITTRFNDLVGQAGAFKSHEITAGLGAYTSDNDYISGRLGAPSEHADLSAAVASTESPAQYGTLSSPRTNPKSTRNMLLECDNVVVSAVGTDQATITFDNKNSHIGTTVNGNSNSGTAVLFVSSTTDFEVDEIIEIGEGTARYEEGEILSINAGISVTLKANLTYTHLAVDADQVRKVLRQSTLPFIFYGVVSGSYPQQTFVPPTDRWGEIYTGFAIPFDSLVFTFKRRGHSVTITGLNPGTTYYFKAGGYNPMEEHLMSVAEYSFTTLPAAVYTDPGITNVRSGIAYLFAGVPLTGLLDLPSINDVRLGIQFDQTTKTGNARIPTVGNVKIGHIYDTLDSLTGTYDGSDRWTDPSIANVRLGIAYKINSLIDNRVGTLDLPSVNDVRSGTVFDNLLQIGLLDLPSVLDVKIGVQFDQLTKTGTYDGSDRWSDPGENNVKNGVTYRANSLILNRIGNVIMPLENTVLAGITYDSLSSRTGTLVSPSAAAIAQAVWDEILTTHNIVDSAGKEVQDTNANARQAKNLIISDS